MNTMILQVPVDKNIKLSAQEAASNMGFSSLQDAVRLFLANMASGKLSASFTAQTPDEILTPEQDKIMVKKYKQAMKELSSGKLKTYTNVDDMMIDLKGGN